LRVLLLFASFAACEPERPDPPADPIPDSSEPDVVPGLASLADRTAQPAAPPRIDPGGGFRIESGPPLHGDPDACAAFHACCDGVNGQVSPAGLACGLAPAAASGDCRRALESVRAVFLEQKIPPPPGCG
jgi:hypothetical protein